MENNRKAVADHNSVKSNSKSNNHSVPNGTNVGPAARQLLPGGGEMGERIRAFDWSRTPLGAIDSWSPALLTTVRILLLNRFPLLLWWGPEYISIYNDAYIPILGEKHDWALGKPVRECWQEIWHILQPLIDTQFKGGPATWDNDIFLEIKRHGFIEESHFTIAYSPVPDESAPNGIGGVLATVNEITEQVIGERRIVALRDLAARVGDARTAEEACRMAAETLAGHSQDIPFALLYLIDKDNRHGYLAGAAGVPINEEISPLVVDLDKDEENSWPLATAHKTETIQVVEKIGKRFSFVPPGPWSDPPDTAVIVPIPSNKAHEPVGLMIAGLSARSKFDQLYQDFIELVRTQIATAIGNARVYEEERRRAEALAQIDRAKTTFFSNVSHEFRTPLTLMLGPLEEILAQNNLPAGDREQLELIYRNALRQLKLVNTLLDFSRIETGRIEANYEPIDLAEYTAELASLFQSAIEHAGLKLVVDCHPLSKPVFVDREMWEKIVLNLLSNAFKFTFQGEIEIALRQSGEWVELTVRDTGVGIPAHEHSHIFERFYRVRGVQSRTNEGTGIGLSLVQELVQLHGGRIEFTSAENTGTTFKILIPSGKSHLPAERIGAARSLALAAIGVEPYVQEMLSWLPEEDRTDTVVQLPVPIKEDTGLSFQDQQVISAGRARILLADDNADMRKYISRLLNQSNYEVQAVPDGQAALQAARLHMPDLVLTDIMMPGLNGLELLDALRADPVTATVPVIMLSARAGEEARVEGLESGANDYLIKPFSARELLARVKAHLEISRIRREAEQAIQYRSAQFETLLNQAPLGVYLVDANFCIREMNPMGRELFGDIPDLVGRNYGDVVRLLWTQEYADELVRIFGKTLETGTPFEMPERIEYRIDRHVKEFHQWRLVRILLPDGQYGLVCYFRDISAQVRARAKLAESEERYRGIVNQSVGGIVEADPTGRFITVNDRFCQMTGYSREELLHLRMLDLTHPEDLPHSRELLDNLVNGGTPYEIEKRYIRKDGSVIWVHKSVSAIRKSGSTAVRSLIAVLLDVTKSKQIEIALQQLNLQLENLVSDRTAELRATNQTLHQEIAERIRVEEELSLSRDRLRQLSRRLVEVQEQERRAIARELHDRVGQTLSALNINLSIMSQQLTDESRKRVGERFKDSMKLTSEVIDLIRTVVSDLRPTVLYDYGLEAALANIIREHESRYGLEIRFDRSGTAIPRLEPGISTTVLRILQEALTNVVRHAQAEHVYVSIELIEEKLHLVVQDDGVGITDIAKAGRPASHGLQIMRQRAEAFGGNLYIGSAPERGTHVEAYIPIQGIKPLPGGESKSLFE